MQHDIYCATTKSNPFWSLLCDKWYLWLCVIFVMIYRLQLILYTSKFNLKIFLVYTKYVQFHNIKFKMPNFQFLIGLQTRALKTDRKLIYQHLFPIKIIHLVLPPPPSSVRFVHLWKCWQLWMAPYQVSDGHYLWGSPQIWVLLVLLIQPIC